MRLSSTIIFILIAVMLRLERPGFRYTEVIRLFFGQFIQFNADLGQMEPGHFLIQVLGKYIYIIPVALVIGPEFYLCQGLVAE